MTLAMCTVRLRSQSSRSRRIGRCVFSLIRIGQRQCRAVDEKCVGRAPLLRVGAGACARACAALGPARRPQRSRDNTRLEALEPAGQACRAGALPEHFTDRPKIDPCPRSPPHPARVVPPPRQPATTELSRDTKTKRTRPDIWPNSGAKFCTPYMGDPASGNHKLHVNDFRKLLHAIPIANKCWGGRSSADRLSPAKTPVAAAGSLRDPESSTSRAFARGVRGGFGDAVRLAPRGRPEGRSAERLYPDTGLRRGHACHPHAA